MSTEPIIPMPSFTPMFIFPNEYAFFGLPNNKVQPDIDNIVQTASGQIDTYCGRVDSDGNGSLVYTTYTMRLMCQSPGRNLALLPEKPLVSLMQSDIDNLVVAASGSLWQMSTLGLTVSGNYFYTGVLPSINTLADGRLSAVIGASGRYTYQRRDTYPLQNDPNGIINPLNTITLFGGPPPWIPIDMVNLDYDPRTGELWYAAGQWMERYTEIVIQYTCGFNPLAIPPLVKRATAAAVKNLLGMGGGATGIKSFSGGGVSVQFGADALDDNIKRTLEPFVAVRTY